MIPTGSLLKPSLPRPAQVRHQVKVSRGPRSLGPEANVRPDGLLLDFLALTPVTDLAGH